MKKSYKTIVPLLLFWAINMEVILAQTTGRFPYQSNIKSPEASSLGQFGQIPISLFNGLPEISIPIDEIKCGNLTLPLKLQYYAGGNRPDQHPGWVGLGWNLQAGGAITREVNGSRDEGIDNRSYYDSRSELNTSNWNTLDFIKTKVGNDLSPDEFSFSFNGISGSFYLNYDGTWKVKSKDNIKFKVEHEIQSNFPIVVNGHTDNIPRTFTKFVITANDGTKYIFGGSANSIEFSYPAMPGVTYFGDPMAYGDYYQTYPPLHNVESNAWYLTKIVSPEGREIEFIYSTAATLNLSQSIYTNIWYSEASGVSISNLDYNETNQNLVTKYYLEKIIIDDAITCSFYKSPSTELNWIWRENSTKYNSFMMYSIGSSWNYHKMDSINIAYAGKVIKKISCEYTSNANERLKLKKVNFKSSDNKSVYTYKFDYNSKPLPVYNAGMEDHWGFYNGRTAWPGGPTINTTVAQEYFQTREPDTAYIDAEILEKITYPTNGYTLFYFEPHQYSSVVKQYPTIACTPISQNKIAGGLRIKKMVNVDNFNTVNTREFFYIKDYLSGGTVSSGVLSGTPNYYEEGSGTNADGKQQSIRVLSSRPLKFLNATNGNHITYSEVLEKGLEDGFIVHKFANQDNGYLDKPAFATAVPLSNMAPELYENKTFGKLELERGLPLANLYYSRDKTLVKEEIFEYNNDPSRYQEYVRAVQFNTFDRMGIGNVAAIPVFTFYPFLKKQTTKIYSSSTEFLSQAEQYEYNNVYRLLKKKVIIDSKDNSYVYSYRYPLDIVADGQDGSGVYGRMLSSNIVSPVVEETKFKDDVKLQFLRTNYYEPHPRVYVPSSIQTQNINGPLETRQLFHTYDSFGNLFEMSKANDVHEVYFWGYNRHYIVAKVIGTDFTSAQKYINQDVLDNPTTTDAQMINELSKLRTNLPNTLVTTYTHAPLIGITSETDLSGKATYYEYDKLGRLQFVKDRNKRILKIYCYNYNGQREDCGGLVFLNKSITQTFTKQCSAGYQGSKVPYTVPEGKWTAGSQTEADKRAQEDMSKNGQANANTKGTCSKLYGNVEITGTFHKTCGTGGTSNDVSYTVPAGKYQELTLEEANRKAQADLTTEGQKKAEQDGVCAHKNQPQSGAFIKQGCTAPYIGEKVIYTVNAGEHISHTSLQEANDMARAQVNEKGQDYANATGKCVRVYAKFVQRNINTIPDIKQTADIYVLFFSDKNCSIPFEATNMTVEYDFVTKRCGDLNTPTSTRQSKVCNGREALIKQGAVLYENLGDENHCHEYRYVIAIGAQYLPCGFAYTNDAISRPFTPQCASGYEPVTYYFKVPAGAHESDLSKDDAQRKAEDYVNQHGQAEANLKGICKYIYYNDEMSVTLQRTNCGEGYEGGMYTYVVAAGKHRSLESKDDANRKARIDLDENGQNEANLKGVCTPSPKFFSDAKTVPFIKECPTGYIGTEVLFTTAYGDFFSYESKDDANRKRDDYIRDHGQAYANANGACNELIVYARIRYRNVQTVGTRTTADVYVMFYSDDALSRPHSVSNLSVNYEIKLILCNSTTKTTNHSIVCNGTETLIASGATLEQDSDSDVRCQRYDYRATAGTGYTPK